MNHELWTMYHETRLTQPIRAAHPFDEILLYICRGFSTNQLLFMQNKPNVKDAQINVNSYMKSKYVKMDTWLSGKNKPNSNPIRQACVVCEGVAGLIKPNSQKAKMNVNLTLTKGYRKKDDFVARINKPNFRNDQNERKLSYNKGLQKKRLFSTPKNKPNSNPISKGQNELKIACQKIRPHPYPPRFNCALYKKSFVWHYVTVNPAPPRGRVNMKKSVS
jgi:hypothetical protein